MSKKKVAVITKTVEMMGKTLVAKVSAFGFNLTMDDQTIFKNTTLEEVRRFQSLVGLSLHRMMILQRQELATRTVEHEPADVQEKHSPTKPYTNRVTGKKKKNTATRRTAAVRLFDNLSDELQDAMLEINDAYQAETGEVRTVAIMKYEPPSDRSFGDRQTRGERLLPFYTNWKNLAKRGDFDINAALKIIVLGFELEQQDGELMKRNGWSKANMVDALKAWVKVRDKPVKEKKLKKDFDMGRRNT
ncbi:MAG: hypothetical protein V7727_02190 [Sneathiella sp.]